MISNSISKSSLKSAGSAGSAGSGQSRSTLLFGEIPTPPPSEGRSTRANSHPSVCNLVLTSNPTFLRFWLNEECRDAFLAQVEPADLANLRLTCLDFGAKAAPFLFDEIAVTFQPSTFTRPARMAALDRIGEHVTTFTFNMPHGPETFLPPLVDPWTGEERSVEYVPQVHKPQTLVGKVKQPKYGSWEMTDLLIKQYPPLFHAATNVPAFIRTLTATPNLTHLKISCPGQDPAQRYRRSTVDYALISLRIAVERAPLPALSSLSLLPVHASGLFYLQPAHGVGATPSSPRRWAQIEKLTMHLDSFPTPTDARTRTEHLRLLHNFLRPFSRSLTRFAFRWVGAKGPSPLSLDSEPCLQPAAPPPPTPPSPTRRTTVFPSALPFARPSSSSTSSSRPSPRPLHLRRLASLTLENCAVDAAQLATLIRRHARSLADFGFEHVALRSGDWDAALAPLTRLTGNEEWKRRAVEVMDVPVVLRVEGALPHPHVAFEGVDEGSVGMERKVRLPPDGVVRPEKVVMACEEAPPERQQKGAAVVRWLARRTRARKAAKGVKEGGAWGCEEQVRRLFKGSVLGWH